MVSMTTPRLSFDLWPLGRSRPGTPVKAGKRASSSRKHEGALSIQQVQVDELLEDDAIIAIMGPTGAGKSSFINIALQQTANTVGHSLASCTADIQAISCEYPFDGGRKIVFVDTPGFDDTEKSDMEILELIADWLSKTYARNVKLAGILYMHRISDNRMAGTPLKNLNMFAKLCGERALENVILTTTMWDEVEEDIGSRREKELKENYWKGMLSAGSKVARFAASFDSAWEIVDLVTAEAADRHALLLQQEMVDLAKQLAETKAGIALHSQLQKLLADQKETLRKLRAAASEQSDDMLKEALQEEYDEIMKKLQATFQDVEALKIPLGKRLQRLVSTRWKFWGKSSRRHSPKPPQHSAAPGRAPAVGEKPQRATGPEPERQPQLPSQPNTEHHCPPNAKTEDPSDRIKQAQRSNETTASRGTRPDPNLILAPSPNVPVSTLPLALHFPEAHANSPISASAQSTRDTDTKPMPQNLLASCDGYQASNPSASYPIQSEDARPTPRDNNLSQPPSRNQSAFVLPAAESRALSTDAAPVPERNSPSLLVPLPATSELLNAHQPPSQKFPPPASPITLPTPSQPPEIPDEPPSPLQEQRPNQIPWRLRANSIRSTQFEPPTDRPGTPSRLSPYNLQNSSGELPRERSGGIFSIFRRNKRSPAPSEDASDERR